jgi:hypothetical protein
MLEIWTNFMTQLPIPIHGWLSYSEFALVQISSDSDAAAEKTPALSAT